MSEFDKSAVRVLLRFGVGVVVFACTVFFFKYLLAPLLPFLLAWLLSAMVKPFADKLKKRTRISYRFWCVLLLVVFSLLLFALLWFLLSGVVKELSHFITNEQSVGMRLESLYSSVFRLIEKYLPSLYARIDRQAVNERLLSLLSELSVSASMHLARFAFTLPEILLFVVISYLAAYYITVDAGALSNKLFSYMAPSFGNKIKSLFGAFTASLKNYFKAGGLLLILTFCELLAGFMILRIDFPILFALVIAAVDFLPVLGTGTVLIPWGLVLMVAGEQGKGVGLLVLWLVTVVVRQLAEPRIYGKTLGVHPLLTLAATYFGLKLFGIWGMLTFPIVLAVLSGMLKKEENGIQ
ncbi:MAG: sporulation integral membrane protein YtvI [Clostridia bacterium]|nr:sporulation integral membrane protein YtvI [Clostridia bacterium]